MYFIRCNNNEQINKKLDKTNKPSIFHKGLSHGLSVLACVSPKGKAVQHQDSLWAKAVYMFRHFKTEYGRSVSVNREQPSFEQGPVEFSFSVQYRVQ